jgi:hypothetical protein
VPLPQSTPPKIKVITAGQIFFLSIEDIVSVVDFDGIEREVYWWGNFFRGTSTN